MKKDEPIYICRGYIFDALRTWLTRQGFQWQNTKIEGLLQEKVEESFNEYVIKLGLPRSFIQHARYAFGFHRLLKWIFADYPNRCRLCKTGWKSWNKWSQVTFTVFFAYSAKEAYCLKCGKLINKNELVTTVEYVTNRPWSLYLHPGCSDYDPSVPGAGDIQKQVENKTRAPISTRN